MKRFLLLVLSITFAIQIFGKQVTIEKAQNVATTFLRNQKGTTLKSSIQINLALLGEITPQLQNQGGVLKSAKTNIPYYYIFNVNGNEGFVIVSGDDAALPILGYSNTNGIDINNLPPAFIKWMEGYKKQIQYLRANNIVPSEQIKNMWEDIGSATKLKSTKSGVAPLIQTKWDQLPIYNNLCPRKYFWNDRASTGCVATAMAQIMRYYNSPAQGTGFHSYYHSNSNVTYGTLSANFGSTTYDWANMPNQLTGSTTTAQNDAVATLMYHCGVSVDMDYNDDGKLSSGADPRKVVDALKNYFQYDNNITFITLKDYYTSYGDKFLDEWKKTLKAELNNNRPIQYGGYSPAGNSGHSFICDGYDENDFFHFNWGWSGHANDYYSLLALIPTETGVGAGFGEYTFDQSAIIGIKPKAGSDKQIGLYSSITIPTIYQLLAFDIKASIANYGTTDFTGSFCAAIFDNSGAFIDYIENKANQSLSAGYYLGNVTFHSAGLALYPGTYYIGLYYKITDGNWIALQKHGFNNYVAVQVLSPFPTRDLRLYDSIRISPNPILKGRPLDVTFDIANYGTSTYGGTLAVGLYDKKGNLSEIINYNDHFTLNAGYHFTNGLKFSSTGITSELGSYMIAVMEIPTGETTGYVVTPNNYLNPLMVNVSAPPLNPDPYEKNDTLTSAYNLPVSFIDNNTTITTIGTNIHTANDIDFFKLNLPSGYNYSITARVHDSNNSGNGQTYTCDVLWAYKLNSVWSDLYDDVAPNAISIGNGGIVYFAVMPYFKGETGTYLLEIKIIRSVLTSTNDVKPINSFVLMYPNPAKDLVTIISDRQVDSYRILDMTGRVLDNKTINEKFAEINISTLNAGIYYLQIVCGDQIETKKLIKDE